MNPKPFSEVVEEQKEYENTIKPFVEEAIGGVELKNEILLNQKKIGIFQKTLNFLSSLKGLLFIATFFILVVVILNTIETIEQLLLSHSILDTVYLIALTILALSLTIISFKSIRQIKLLKDAKEEQDFFIKQKTEPNIELIVATQKLLKHYEVHPNQSVRKQVSTLQKSIKNSHEYSTVYKSLDESVLSSIDILAQEKIRVASLQASISTAISPLALIDVLIVIWRSFLLTKDIAELYGFKPGYITTLSLLKQGSFNIFFAGAVELASEYANEIAGHSLTAKVSTSAGQGVANGILLARLGYGVMKACRPLPLQSKRSSFMKGIYSSIKELVIKPDSNTLR